MKIAKTIFIFSILYSNLLSMKYFGQQYAEPKKQKLTPEEENFLIMKSQIKSGDSCLEGDLYNAVRESSASMKYYCEFICNLYRRAKDPNYIANRYGHKGERLGSGSFGVVYKYTSGNGKEYAIKIPKSFKYSALFEELNASQCIKKKLDPFWIKKMGIILECVSPPKENPHLIMNYFSKTLEDKMNEEYSLDYTTYSADKKERLYYDMYILTAEMRQLHNNGLAHRDFKPENAMIDDENLPVLVDFGLTTPNLVNAKTVCGTPLFLDPELITYKNTGGATADVYALGITFYMMMSGNAGADTVNSMLLSGGYGTLGFNPNFNLLGLTGEKAFIKNMLISSKKGYGRDTRWNIEQVYQYLKKIVTELANKRQEQEAQMQELKKLQDQQKEIARQREIDEINRQKEYQAQMQKQKEIDEMNRQREYQAQLQRQKELDELKRQREYQAQLQKKQEMSRYAQPSNAQNQYQGHQIPSSRPLTDQNYRRPQTYIPQAKIPSMDAHRSPYNNQVYNQGENLANYERHLNKDAILKNVNIYYGQPRVVRVVRYLN